ncbi:uncharacterized protein CTRU02_213095 [Colletotrichum truncatum]|uniref:Uncharacterized protein n=1 Tax=Colletotrichum truncatum TaxID=5467 RepID=A0ACC3YJW5_COLTU
MGENTTRVGDYLILQKPSNDRSNSSLSQNSDSPESLQGLVRTA